MLLTVTIAAAVASAATPPERPCRRIVSPLAYSAPLARAEPVRCWRRVAPLA